MVLATRARQFLIITFLAYLVWLRRNWKRIKFLMSIPPGVPTSITGCVTSVIRDGITTFRYGDGPAIPHVFDIVKKRGEKYRRDGLFAVHVGHPLLPFSMSKIISTDMEIARQVLHQKAVGKFIKGPTYRTSKPLVGDGVLSAPDSAAWRTMRDLANAGVKVPQLERAVKVVAGYSCQMMDGWNKQLASKPDALTSIEFYDFAVRLTMDVLGQVACSYDFKSVVAETPEEAPLYTAMQTILNTLCMRGIRNQPDWVGKLPIPENIRFDKAIGKLTNLCNDLVQNRKAEMKNRGSADAPVAFDMLESFLKRDDQSGSQLVTDQQIIDCLRTLLFAGHDTTASALTWAVYLLAKYPVWQQRVRDEAKAAGFKARSQVSKAEEVLPEGFTLHKIEELMDLTAVVRETLRLYPSAGFTREALAPFTVKASNGKEFEIPPGVELFFFPNIVHHDPEKFEDPLEFKPERWFGMEASPKGSTVGSPGAGEGSSGARAIGSPAAASPGSRRARVGGAKSPYFPFSLGSRNCVGERLAQTEIRVALATLLMSFSFELPKNAPEPYQVLLLSMQPYETKVTVKPL